MGIVAFKMAKLQPEMVTLLVVSVSILAITDSINEMTLERIG